MSGGNSPNHPDFKVGPCVRLHPIGLLHTSYMYEIDTFTPLKNTIEIAIIVKVFRCLRRIARIY